MKQEELIRKIRKNIGRETRKTTLNLLLEDGNVSWESKAIFYYFLANINEDYFSSECHCKGTFGEELYHELIKNLQENGYFLD